MDDAAYLHEIDEQIRLAVAGGYDDPALIAELVTELIEYDPESAGFIARLDSPLEAHIAAVLADALEAHRSAEAAFPPVTDCDRLRGAFARLEAAGILTGEDIGMTMSDVSSDMWERLGQAEAAGAEPRGWVAFHRQDLDRVVDTGVLCLAYAATSDLDDDFVVIAGEAAEVLAAAGFDVRWDGSAAKRLELHGVVWQMRRFTMAPEPEPEPQTEDPPARTRRRWRRS